MGRLSLQGDPCTPSWRYRCLLDSLWDQQLSRRLDNTPPLWKYYHTIDPSEFPHFSVPKFSFLLRSLPGELLWSFKKYSPLMEQRFEVYLGRKTRRHQFLTFNSFVGLCACRLHRARCRCGCVLLLSRTSRALADNRSHPLTQAHYVL